MTDAKAMALGWTAGAETGPLSADEITFLRRLLREASPAPWVGDNDESLTSANVRLAQAMRAALPRLLDEVEHLRGEIDEWREIAIERGEGS
jgi:hypothetical protein